MNLISILSILAAASWLGIIGAVALAVARAARGESVKGSTGLIIVAVVAAVALNVLSAGLVFVEPNERGVVITIREGGVRPVALQPGLRWVIPFAETVVTYSISSQNYTMSIASGEGAVAGDDSVESRTQDLQQIKVDGSVIFKIDPARVIEDIHIRWEGGQYIDRLVRPQSRGVIRQAVSGFTVQQVYAENRADLERLIEEDLRVIFAEGGLILESFVLRNIAVTPEYAAVLEAKQIADQRVLEEENITRQRFEVARQVQITAEGEANAAIARAEGEKTARILRAEGEAAALKIQAEADAVARELRSIAEAAALLRLGEAIDEYPDVLLLQYIQKLAENITVMLLPSNNPFLLPLPELDGTP